MNYGREQETSGKDQEDTNKLGKEKETELILKKVSEDEDHTETYRR